MSETLYIVMPTYNEEANIKNVVEEWYPILECANENSRLVIADGGSKDNTLSILNDLQKCYSKLEVVSRPGTDHGTKVVWLYRYAISQGADWIFQTDSDGQTLPHEFAAFWEMRDNYDAVMGNRAYRGDGAGRKIVENVLRTYLKVFFGTWVPDANAPFRLMRSISIEKYIDILPDNFNLPNAIITACLARYNERVIYKEVTFQPRQGGKNYMNVRRIIKIGIASVKNFAQIKRNMQEFERRNLLK